MSLMHWLVVLAIVLGIACCLIAAYTGLAIGDEESVQAFGLIWLFPVTFLSSAFVPIATMPGWLQAFVKVNPISHVADATRDLMNNTGGAGVIWSLVAILAITLVFAPLTLHLYSKQC